MGVGWEVSAPKMGVSGLDPGFLAHFCGPRQGMRRSFLIPNDVSGDEQP